MPYKLDLRKSVANLFGKLSTKEILGRFRDKPISRTTIFRVLQDCGEGKEQGIKRISGRPTKLSRRDVWSKQLLASAKNNPNQSTRKLVQRILTKNQLVYRERQGAPEHTRQQLENIVEFCRTLRLKHCANGEFIVLDGESYFAYSLRELSDAAEYASESECEPKVLVWVAMSSKGISEALIRPIRTRVMDSDTYANQCLTKLK